MDTNFERNENIESGIQFSAKLLNIVLYIGIIGAVLTVLPFVLTVDNDIPVETVLNIGDILTSIAGIVFISLISYKLYKDGIAKPSYSLIACYAGVIALNFIVDLINEDLGDITSIIYLICTVGAGFIFLVAQDTKKIGIWMLLSIAGIIILAAIVSNDGYENTHKITAKFLAALYVVPYGIYLEKCSKFLTGNDRTH